MPYEDYTQETAGRFVMPDIDTGIVPFRPPHPTMFGPGWGPHGAHYQTPCDRAIGANIGTPYGGSALSPHPVVGGIHPRNWDLFEYPSGPWTEKCPPPGRMHTEGLPVPAWERRRGVPTQSVMAEGFSARPAYGGQLAPPWIAPAGNPTVTREHPYNYGQLNPDVWPGPGATESSYVTGLDPRPLFYGPQAPNGGMPAHHGPFYPQLRTQHPHRPATAPPQNVNGGEGGCGTCGGFAIPGQERFPLILIIAFVLIILLVCMIAGGSAKRTVVVHAPGAGVPAPSVSERTLESAAQAFTTED